VEEGTQPRPLRADQIVAWNKEVEGWRGELFLIASRFGAGVCEHFHDETAKTSIPLANLHLGLVGR
jgi:hypothetical protein